MTPTEINRRVAEACGLPICTPNGPPEPESGPYFYDDGGDPLMLCRARPEEPELTGDQYGAVFDPYHDANDALWAVVQMKRHGVELARLSKQDRVCDGLWRCQLDMPQLDIYSPSVVAKTGDTAGEAVCNAILAAMNVIEGTKANA